MPFLYPGAVHRPTGDNGAMGRAPDAFTGHIAVTRAETSVFGWQQSAKACHGFVGKRGYTEQYVPYNRMVAGVKDGNAHIVTWESYDGLQILQNPYREIGIGGIYGTNADNGRWDPEQCERFSDILAHAHLDPDIRLNLRVMQSSRKGETGFGPHRLGVDPWRVSGGESWTKHPGKRCPGDLRVQQIPGIVARAIEIAAAVRKGICTWLPVGFVDLDKALARTATVVVKPSQPTTSKPTFPLPIPLPPKDADMTQQEYDQLYRAALDAHPGAFVTKVSDAAGDDLWALGPNPHRVPNPDVLRYGRWSGAYKPPVEHNNTAEASVPIDVAVQITMAHLGIDPHAAIVRLAEIGLVRK